MQDSARSDGRSALDLRPFDIQFGTLHRADGSARVSLGLFSSVVLLSHQTFADCLVLLALGQDPCRWSPHSLDLWRCASGMSAWTGPRSRYTTVPWMVLPVRSTLDHFKPIPVADLPPFRYRCRYLLESARELARNGSPPPPPAHVSPSFARPPHPPGPLFAPSARPPQVDRPL